MPSGKAAGERPELDLTADDDDLLRGVPSAIVEPSIEFRPSHLDTDRLNTSKDFELLLAQIVSEVHGLQNVKLYGEHGQRQHGIDIVGVARDHKVWALQAKRYKVFRPADLKKAVAKFANAARLDDGSRVLRVSKLVIAVACEARTTGVIETFYALCKEARTSEHPYDLCFWDRQDLSDQMRTKPAIVRRFFGDHAADRFCDSTGKTTEPSSSASGPSDPEPDTLAPPLTSPAVLTDIVMVGPERASGADTVLSEAREIVAANPAQAAELFLAAEGLLTGRGFVLQAAVVSEARAQALVSSRQFSAAAEVLLARFWSALDRGSHFDCRRIEHDLDKVVQVSESDPAAASAAATAHAASTILRSPEAELAAAGELLTSFSASLGTVQLARLASETAAAGGFWSWLTQHAATLQTAANHAQTVGLFHDGLRIALCIADATDVWSALLDRAQMTDTPLFSAVIQARYARRCAYRHETTTARQSWMSAAAIAAERGWNSDASEWLFAISKLRMRFNPLDPADDQARNSARALHSVSGPASVYSASGNSREAGLDASQAGRGSEAIDNLQDYLRSSFAAGRWVDEDDARTLLASALINVGRFTEAARHLVTAGITKFDPLLEAAGHEYLDVTDILQDPRTSAYWQRAAALRLIERQADLVPDNQVSNVIDFGLNVIALATSDPPFVDNHPMFAPSLYLSAHAALAALADAMTVLQAERLLKFLAPLIPREPDHYRHSDEAHVRGCVAIARHFPTLRDAALDQLLSLIETNDSSIAVHINRHARNILGEHLALIRGRLERDAAGDNREAIELLADIGPEDGQPNPTRLDAAEAAFTRLTTPVVHVPGVYSVGTNAPMDAVVARVLPPKQVAAALTAQFDKARDPRSPLTNRADYLAAAFNLAMKLGDERTDNLFAAAVELTHDSGRSEDPLAEFGRPATDLRRNASLLSSALARTPEQKQEALRIGLRLLAQTDNAGSTVTHMLRVIEPPDVQAYLPLLASQRDGTLRAYAASKWVDSDNPDVDLGLALAGDDDPRVQYALANALAHTPPNKQDAPVREVLARGPYRSARRALFTQT